jgi:hypothetical protein
VRVFASHPIPGPNLTSPKKRQSPIEIKPLGYNKQYHSWELVCHTVKDLVLPTPKGPSPRMKAKLHQCILFFMNEKKEEKKRIANRPDQVNFLLERIKNSMARRTIRWTTKENAKESPKKLEACRNHGEHYWHVHYNFNEVQVQIYYAV